MQPFKVVPKSHYSENLGSIFEVFIKIETTSMKISLKELVLVKFEAYSIWFHFKLDQNVLCNSYFQIGC